MSPPSATRVGTQASAAVLARCGNAESIVEDRNKVRDYVKDNLFERSIFIYSKSALDQGGVLHNDYLKNCRALIANGTLVHAADSDAETYMNFLWSIMVKANCYREWMSNKRSSRYQAVQDKFDSECCIMSENACLLGHV